MTTILSLLAAAASLALALLGTLFLTRTTRMYALTTWLADGHSGGRVTEESVHRFTIANGIVCLVIAAILAFFAVDALLL